MDSGNNINRIAEGDQYLQFPILTNNAELLDLNNRLPINFWVEFFFISSIA